MEGRKKLPYLPLIYLIKWGSGWSSSKSFLDFQLWQVTVLQPLDLWWWIVAHLKNPSDINFHFTEKQHRSTLKECNLGSNLPYLYSTYVLVKSINWQRLYFFVDFNHFGQIVNPFSLRKLSFKLGKLGCYRVFYLSFSTLFQPFLDFSQLNCDDFSELLLKVVKID